MPRRSALLLALSLTTFAPAQVPADKALATMQPGDGLAVSLFAAEPLLVNPTAIDIDHNGRVWVTEAVNYRRVNFKRPILRDAGDRIVILTDADGDGRADRSDVFYQGQELYGPLSVLVLPQADGKAVRVLVAQSPDILEFWDRDGDGRADGPPTKWLTGFGGFDHDHGVHGLTTGPDGKVYFTVGDSGVTGLQSRDGTGRKWVTTRDPNGDCQAGTVWRCDLDGNNLELVAHNFRNNYEAAVDSFGEIWLSDNDDDGNQQTRICHVMPGGNYGYWPRGAGQTHWHEEQPGIVHKTLRTGFGSPTGICFYEGKLLPPKFHGGLVHADAGPREIRCFHRKPKGAGYELDKTRMLTSTDNWFRPSDVCVAPDGSVFVADWYDPGVGGHGMGDHTRGRIYRLTPAGHAGYAVPSVDVGTTAGVLAALDSPNAATRVLAQGCLPGEPVPTDLSVRLKARLVAAATARDTKDGRHGFPHAIDAFGTDPEPLRRLALRLEDALDHTQPDDAKGQLAEALKQHAGRLPDAPGFSPAVAREYLLKARKFTDPAAVRAVFYPLAERYDGDPAYRAALNIACGTDPARRDAILADFDKHFPVWNDHVADLAWELRPKSVLARLDTLMRDPNLTAEQKARVVDILAVSDSPDAGAKVLSLLDGDRPDAVQLRAVNNLAKFLPNKWADLRKSDAVRGAIRRGLTADNPSVGLMLAEAAPDRVALADLKVAAGRHPEARRQAVRIAGRLRTAEAVAYLSSLTADPVLGADALTAVGESVANQGGDAVSQQALAVLEKIALDPAVPLTRREAAVAALAGSRGGTIWLLRLKEKAEFPKELQAAAGPLLRASPYQGERNKALLLFPVAGTLDPAKLPSSRELAEKAGDPARGKAILLKSKTSEVQCLKCHKVKGDGGEIGPDLSLIGKKASVENLLDSILHPSKAIADQYVSWTVATADGQSITGLLVGESESTVTIRDANGKDHPIPVADIEKRSKSLVSLMPEDLIRTLTEQELLDLVAYLATLRDRATAL
jgi:putative membrane-bound dehydrogenase-like protein